MNLLADSNSNGTCPKRVTPGGASGRAWQSTWADPGANVTTRDGIDSESPKGLLDAVVTWEAPCESEGGGEMGEGSGHSRGCGGGDGEEAYVGNVVLPTGR